MSQLLQKHLTLWWVCAVFAVAFSAATYNSSVLAADNSQLSAATLQQIASARAATAKYHDVEQAVADGYVNIDLYLSGEGFHYVNFSLVDETFDPEHPEVLLYAPLGQGDQLELVGVEYLIPLALSVGPPEGFIGEADEWREDSEGFGLWEVNAWLWLENPEGIFGHDNSRIP